MGACLNITDRLPDFIRLIKQTLFWNCVLKGEHGKEGGFCDVLCDKCKNIQITLCLSLNMYYFNKRLCDILKNVWAKIKDKWSYF